MDYMIVIEDLGCISELVEEINKQIRRGYRPFGGLTIDHETRQLLQPMIKE